MDRDLIICDIKAVTYYTDKDFEKMTDKQLYAMKCRIFTDITRFRKEIIQYFIDHPEERVMSNQDVNTLNYNDLASLRKELGLAKKKVKSTTEAPELASKARKKVKETDTRQLSLTVIKAQDEYERQECLLYMDEIIQMGYGDYSREELMNMGIIPLDMEEDHLKK